MRPLHLVAVVAFLAAGCSRSVPAGSAEAAPGAAAAAAAAAEAAANAADAAAAPHWQYAASKDKMTDRIHRSATIESSDTISAFGPYPASPVTLTIYDDGSTFLSTAQQFDCSSEYCSISVRFDGAPAAQVRADDLHMDPPSISLQDSSPAAGQSEMPLSDFIAKVKHSETMLVQVPIFERGAPVVTFNLAGFDEKKLNAVAP
jgi:hypothetical protein